MTSKLLIVVVVVVVLVVLLVLAAILNPRARAKARARNQIEAAERKRGQADDLRQKAAKLDPRLKHGEPTTN